ncbi:hypothetical protein [Streptomyces sp. NBC_01477]|uniref:hypothetical protein n=1 Tax=Streptomyces sp. NBC_01477 TaxID=2976015 RepID=UPI002E31E841|nr:hypothetical protein [Streptomyces sp. NBC_01477]
MSVPYIALTSSQHQLLAELVLSTLPSPAHEPESAVARGLSQHQMQSDASALLWMGLIAESKGILSVTLLGSVVYQRAAREDAENRLVAVAAFADALEAASHSEVDQRRISYALRQLAQGAITLDEAVGYLS